MKSQIDIKKQIANLKGKTEEEIFEFMENCEKNGQIKKFTSEDRKKVAEALEYALDNGLNKVDMMYERYNR